MFYIWAQSYKILPKYAIPRNGDAEVYQLLSIARYFKTPYLCTRNRKSAVMLATPERQTRSEVETANRYPHFFLRFTSR